MLNNDEVRLSLISFGALMKTIWQKCAFQPINEKKKYLEGNKSKVSTDIH